MRLIIICNKNEYVKDFPTEQEIESVIRESATENLMDELPLFLKKYDFQKCQIIDILMNQLKYIQNNAYILYDMDNHIVVHPNKPSVSDVDFMIDTKSR